MYRSVVKNIYYTHYKLLFDDQSNFWPNKKMPIKLPNGCCHQRLI